MNQRISVHSEMSAPKSPCFGLYAHWTLILTSRLWELCQFPMAAVTNYHKLLKPWLETMEMYCLTVLEARSSASVSLGEIKVSLGLYSLWRLVGRTCSLPLPVFLIPASISWFVDVLLQGLPPRSHCLLHFLCACQIFCSFLIWIHDCFGGPVESSRILSPFQDS